MYVRLIEGQSFSALMMSSQSGDSSPPPMDENETRSSLPKSKLTFKINERMARVAMWINQVLPLQV